MRISWRIWILLLALSGVGCLPHARETSVPVPTEWFAISEAGPRDTTLLVMLPGRRSDAADFEKYGFIEAIPPEARLDAVAVDLHFGYYRERSLDERLREDVIEPAIEKGYRRIEILGISMGGLGGLIYALEHPGEVERLTLLAPYVGDDLIVEEIESAGGLGPWEPGVVKESDFQRRLWTSLKDWIPANGAVSGPKLRIAVGEGDRHRDSNDFFARELLGGRILRRPGGHDWDTWKRLYLELFELENPEP